MTYTLGIASTRNLAAVNDPIKQVVNRAIEISEIDFSVVEGLRTAKRQQELYDNGKTWTLDSKHISGNAVDIYPWIKGATSHSDEHYNLVAKAMFRASQELGIVIEWGGFWSPERTDKPHWQKV